MVSYPSSWMAVARQSTLALALALQLGCCLGDTCAGHELCDNVQLVQRRAERDGAGFAKLEADGTEVPQEVMFDLSELILQGFDRADQGNDGIVTLDDMRVHFGHAGYVRRTYRIFQKMLNACTGHRNSAACSREELEDSVKRWATSSEARRAMAKHGRNGDASFFMRVEDEHEHSEREGGVDFALNETVECGPTVAEKPAPGFENVKCTWTEPQCWKADGLLAWSQSDLCVSRGCLCEPTKETKRLAKLGVMGALAVTTAKNWADVNDTLMTPACGDQWSATKVMGEVHDLNRQLDFKERLIVDIASLIVAQKEDGGQIRRNDSDRTEVALFKSSNHHLVKGGEPGKVCMISWQATRDNGDWKTNLMIADIPFKYGPKNHSMKAPKGLVLAYGSIRDKLYKAFKGECCTSEFHADQVIISGHSHGGAMAELNAVDVISNWACRGKDLGAAEVTLVTAAPHASLIKLPTLAKVFSCNDPKACLTGRVVTLVAEGDFVGDGFLKSLAGGGPIHPGAVSMFKPPPAPEDQKYALSNNRGRDWNSHGIWNYIQVLEEEFVGRRGWGSSCNGHCGDPNRQVQCNQYVLIKRTGCVYANASELLPPTQCTGWDAAGEKCQCSFDRCDALTTLGCEA